MYDIALSSIFPTPPSSQTDLIERVLNEQELFWLDRPQPTVFDSPDISFSTATTSSSSSFSSSSSDISNPADVIPLAQQEDTDSTGSADLTLVAPEWREWWKRGKRAPGPRLPACTAGSVDAYVPCTSSVVLFNSIFPLPPRLFTKWKHGVRIWLQPSAPSKLISRGKTRPCDLHDRVVEALLKADLIHLTKWRMHKAHLFCVPKGESGVRPVFDYSMQTPYASPPPFVLPNLYQVVRAHNWLPGRWYIKLDIKQCFFNIPVHPKSQHLTTFEYRGRRYAFSVLPFGMSISPFVAQMFLNAIMTRIRLFAPESWGHIDDILISHRNKSKLQILAFRVKRWLRAARWPINFTKSVFTPQKSISFLGADWGQAAVTRSPKALPKLLKLVQSIPSLVSAKAVMRARGYLNYYLSFAGPVHRLICLVLLNGRSRRTLAKYLLPLLLPSEIPFVYHRSPFEPSAVESYADAADAIVSIYDSSHCVLHCPHGNSNIMHRELFGVLWTMFRHAEAHPSFTNGSARPLVVHCDNMAAIAAVRHGSMKFMHGLEPTFLVLFFLFVKFR
jgi:hypothetical protein